LIDWLKLLLKMSGKKEIWLIVSFRNFVLLYVLTKLGIYKNHIVTNLLQSICSFSLPSIISMFVEMQLVLVFLCSYTFILICSFLLSLLQRIMGLDIRSCDLERAFKPTWLKLLMQMKVIKKNHAQLTSTQSHKLKF